MAHDDRPTPRQQRYLRSLAQSTATSFTPPATRGEASSEIERLQGLGRSTAAERRVDRHAVQGTERGGAARVRDEEVTGYGSTAAWARRS